MIEMLDLYAENLIYNYENQTNKGRLDNPTILMHEENISCGDQITVYIRIEDNKVKDIKYEGIGCIISMGSANIVCDYVKDKDLNDIINLNLEDLFKIIGFSPTPSRLHCATLGLRAIKRAILNYLSKDSENYLNGL